MVVFDEVGLGPLGLVLLMLAAFAPFHTHKVGRWHSSARWGSPQLTRQSLILILPLPGFFVVVSLKTRLVMGVDDVGGCDGDGYGVGVVGMLKAVVLILDSWS